MSTFAQPQPSYGRTTVSLSLDASIYSQYKLKTELFFCQSINVLKVNKQAKHINVKITV